MITYQNKNNDKNKNIYARDCVLPNHELLTWIIVLTLKFPSVEQVLHCSCGHRYWVPMYNSPVVYPKQYFIVIICHLCLLKSSCLPTYNDLWDMSEGGVTCTLNLKVCFYSSFSYAQYIDHLTVYDFLCSLSPLWK